MFLQLTVENVRKKGKIQYNFRNARMVFLQGANGAGKSTVCEALIFAMTGRDRSGGTYPTHLIARGEVGMKTTVDLKGGWTVARTLTQKKNTTIHVTGPNGIDFKVSQQQLMETMGFAELPVEVYIASTVPGYFMTQPSQRRFSLLSAALPKFDRVKFVADYSGLDSETVSRLCGGFSRGIPNWHNFSHYRVDLQKRKAKMEGRIEEILRNRSMNWEMPQEPFAVKLLPIAQKYLDDTNQYTSDVQNYIRIKNQYDYCVLEEKRREGALEDINKRLENLLMYEPLDDVVPLGVRMGELQSQILPMPQIPSVANLPQEDMCPSCGQVVGSLLRERVSQENKEKMEEFRKKKDEAEKHNTPLYEEIQNLRQKISEILDKNEEIKARVAAARQMGEVLRKQQLELSMLPPLQRPELPPMPMKPPLIEELVRHNIGPYKKDLITLQDEIDRYNKKVGVYEKQMKEKEEGDTIIAGLQEDMENLDMDISKFEKFEHALRILPQEEVTSQRDLLKMDGYDMDFTDGFELRHSSGTPYECMSAGEQIRVDAALCGKIQSLLETKPGWVFVDDADLLQRPEEVDIPPYIQRFYAHVFDNKDVEGVCLKFE